MNSNTLRKRFACFYVLWFGFRVTLQGIIGKVQDAIGNYDPMVMTDAQANAILDRYTKLPLTTKCLTHLLPS